MKNFNKINKTFLVNTINTELFLIESKNNKQYFESIKSIKNNIKSYNINLLELISCYKQLIRILYFYKKMADKYKNYNHIYLCSINRNILNILKKVIKNIEFQKMYYYNVKPKYINKKVGKFFIVFGEMEQNSIKLVDFFLKQNIFLSMLINSNVNLNLAGLYKIYQEIVNYKKILFVGSVMNSVFNKKYA